MRSGPYFFLVMVVVVVGRPWRKEFQYCSLYFQIFFLHISRQFHCLKLLSTVLEQQDVCYVFSRKTYFKVVLLRKALVHSCRAAQHLLLIVKIHILVWFQWLTTISFLSVQSAKSPLWREWHITWPRIQMDNFVSSTQFPNSESSLFVEKMGQMHQGL